MKKSEIVVIYIVFVSFLILFNSCNSTNVVRHDYSSPVKENAMLLIKQDYIISGGNIHNVVVDGKRINAYYGDNVECLIPAGRHEIYSRIAIPITSGGQSGYTYTFTYEGKTYSSRDRFYANVQGSFEFEQGKFYEFTVEWIDVTRQSDYFYTDKDGKIYQCNFEIDKHGLYHFHLDTILPHFTSIAATNANVTYRLWRIVIKEIVNRKLGSAYIVTDAGPTIGLGIRYPNSLSFSFEPTFGFALYSGKIDMTVYAKAGVAIGIGVEDYKFDDFKNNSLFLVAFPLGVNVDFSREKLGIGIGGGYLIGEKDMYFVHREFSGSVFQYTPYLQLKIGKPHDGSFYIDYYPGVTPVYSGFGVGVLWRF